MRRILGLLAGLVALWAGLWGLLALGFLAVLPNLGLSSGARQFGGWPSHIAITLNDLRLHGGGAAPTLLLRAPLYAPWQISAQMPSAAWGGVQATGVQINAQFAPLAQMALRQGNFAADDLHLNWAGRSAQIAPISGQIYTPPDTGDQPRRAQITAQTGPIAGLLGPNMPPAQAFLRAELHLDAPLALHLAPPRLIAVTLQDMTLNLSAAQISISAQLRPDAAGYAHGQAQVQISGLAYVLNLAAQAGLISAQKADLLANSAQADRANLPLQLQFGQIWLGFIPLGPAPMWPMP